MKLAPSIAERVEQAIVCLPKLAGRGVLVSGGFIVTAAHCIEWTGKGLMALGDSTAFLQEIRTSTGETLLASTSAVEPVSDWAVLGAPDGQSMPEAADAFEAFCEVTPALSLALNGMVLFRSIPAYVFTQNKGVVPVKATQSQEEGHRLSMSGDQRIEGGTSGSPIVTRSGRLLGIVSNFSVVPGTQSGAGIFPRVSHALPLWLVRQMLPSRARRALDAVLPPGHLSPDMLKKLRLRS